MNRKIMAVYVSIIMFTTVFVVFSEHSIATPSEWSEDTRLTNDGSSSYTPEVAVNGINIHIVWHDFRDGNSEVYYKRSTNNGENWGSDTRLTTNDGSSSSTPEVAVNGNNIHIVWHDGRDGYSEVYYKRSTNNGGNWGSDTRLTTNEGSFSIYPSVAVNGNNIHVVWHDDRDGNWEIYYKRSTNNGENWGSDIRLTTNDGSDSINPAVAIDGNNIHVVWYDDRDGNREIYYKQMLNQKPTADTLDFSANHVYKGDVIILYANASDDNDQESDLTPTFEYKPNADTTWQNTCISDVTWDSIGWYWKATFTPSEDMGIGFYDFRVKVTDSDGMDSDWRDGAEQMDVREHTFSILSASTTNIMKGENVTFNASASKGKELVYYFDFGDGAIIDWGYDVVKTHKYTEEGTYIAKVKVKDVYGEESFWDSIEITVSSSKSDGKDSTPGFELILALYAITILLFWKRKKQA